MFMFNSVRSWKVLVKVFNFEFLYIWESWVKRGCSDCFSAFLSVSKVQGKRKQVVLQEDWMGICVCPAAHQLTTTFTQLPQVDGVNSCGAFTFTPQSWTSEESYIGLENRKAVLLLQADSLIEMLLRLFFGKGAQTYCAIKRILWSCLRH